MKEVGEAAAIVVSFFISGSDSSSKERDTETRLDYFGARHVSAAHRRFTSPDRSVKPQPTPYAFVVNNPLSSRDSDGHIAPFGAFVTCGSLTTQGVKARKGVANHPDPGGSTVITQLYIALKQDLAHNGTFDYQRVTFVEGGLQQLRLSRDVSNFNVRLYAQQAGLSMSEIIGIVGDFGKKNSSNYDPSQPYGLDPQTREFTELGYHTGESGVYGK